MHVKATRGYFFIGWKVGFSVGAIWAKVRAILGENGVGSG